jgi:hypothetical protein
MSKLKSLPPQLAEGKAPAHPLAVGQELRQERATRAKT